MKATLIKDDIIVGIASGNIDGPDLPDGVPVERLRAVTDEEGGVTFVDVQDVTAFFIDEAGQKHIQQQDPAWQPVSCAWDARIVNTANQWRARSVNDALAAARARARSDVAAMAEAQRQRYITPGYGKAAVYSIKREEALRWQAESKKGTPDPAAYPWIAARAARKKVAPTEVAAEWLQKTTAWESVGRAIENAYEAAVDAIDALSNPDTIDADAAAIIAAIVWG